MPTRRMCIFAARWVLRARSLLQLQLQLQLKNRRSSDTRTHRKTLLRETYS